MALNIPSSQILIRTGAVYDQFLFFSRPIIIYKEPVQTIVNTPANLLYGYSPDTQTNTDITYSSQSATYSGLIIYPFKNKNQNNQLFDNKIVLKPDTTYIKVAENCKNFIQNGTKNDKIEFDGQTWNIEGNKYQVQTYFGLNFYYFEVKGTN